MTYLIDKSISWIKCYIVSKRLKLFFKKSLDWVRFNVKIAGHLKCIGREPSHGFLVSSSHAVMIDYTIISIVSTQAGELTGKEGGPTH